MWWEVFPRVYKRLLLTIVMRGVLKVMGRVLYLMGGVSKVMMGGVPRVIGRVP